MLNQYKTILHRSAFLIISFFIAIGFIGVSNNAYATHAAGSDLTYRWISGNIYEITVNFYRDCQGVAAPNTVTLNVKSTSCAQNFNVTLNPIAGTGQEITFPCNPTFTYCNGGTNPGVQQYTYRGNVTLPTQCVDWIFSYSVCCRNCAISTITNQANCNNSSTGNALYVEAFLNNVAANHNSSPTFTNIPVAFVCSNQAFTFNHGVVDPNGDSLSYSFINPKRSSTVDVGFLAGYSATNWLTSTPAVAINSSTGDITMTPTTVGQVAVCAVLVKEYRGGVLIGSVIRDMQFWIKDCGTNLLPTASGINGTSNYSTIICPGGSTCFTINSNDGNIGQHITMTSTSTTSIPGSTFTIANQGGASPNYPVGTFCWSPTLLDARDQPYTFTVTVRDDNCNYNAFQIYSYSIVVPRHIITFVSPTYNGYQISCNAGSNGSVTANVSGNQTPIGYHWSTGATTQTINGLAAGTYGITITDVNGCTKDTTVTLTQPAALALSVTSTSANCNGSTNATGTATPTGGIAPYTYLWSNGQTIQTATGLSGGVTYSVTITDANGCTKTGSTTITQPATLSSSVTSTTNVSCNGQSTGAIDLTVIGGTSPYNYLWSNGATTQDLSGLSAGTYIVTITDAHGCTATRSQIITQPGVVVPVITSTSVNGVNVACYGDATGTASVTATGGTLPYSYLWSTGATTSGISGLIAGTVSVTITDANGCLGNGSLTLTQPGGPITIALDSLKNYNGFGTSCNGASNGGIFISVSGGTPIYLYFWSNGGLTQDITGLAAGNYTVTVFDLNGCTASQTYTITPPAPLSVTVTSPVNGGGYNIGCNGESSGSANTSVSGGASPYNYIWSNGATTQNLINLTAGTYSVTVNDANGCSGTGSVTLTEPVILVPLITGVTVNGGTNVTCNGGTDGSASVSATGGSLPYTYLWSNGATSSSVSGLGAGTISVTVYDLNGCSNQDSFTFTEPAPITISSTLSGYNGYNVGCDGATNGSIDATVTGGTSPYSYSWSNGATTQDINSLSAGTYSVTVTDANGCTAISSETLTEPIPIAPVLVSPTVTGGTNLSCNGSTDGSISVTVTGGVSPYTYLWSNGSTTQNLSSIGAGTYAVTVTDANGCTITSSITLTEPATVSPTLTSPTFAGGFNISCNGLFDGIITTSISGGTSPYTFIWSNGETTQDLGSLTAGTYSVTITDVNGCTSSGSKTLTEPTPVVLSFFLSTYGGSNVGCYGSSNGSIDLTVTGGTGPYTYEWTNEETTQDITGLTAGTYGVVVNDANGCPAIDSVTLTQPDTLVSTLISPTFNGGFNVTCLGNDGSIDLTITGGTAPFIYLWSTGATTQDLSGLSAGTYDVTITDANGCTSTGTVTLIQSTTLTLGATLSSYNGNNISCNGNSDGSIDLTVTGGASPFTYIWSNGATTQDLSSLSAGTYTVTVTDANNCSTTATSTITQPTPLTSPTVSSTYNGGYNIACSGSVNGSIDLTPAGGTSPFSYNWSNGSTTQDLSNVGAGIYSVTVTDLNGCTVSTSVTLTEPDTIGLTPISPTFAGGYNVTCIGNDGSIDLTVTGGASPYTYLWSNGATTQDLSAIGAGTFSVTVTDANGCTNVSSITLTQSGNLNATLTPSSYNENGVTCNGATDGYINSTVTGGASPYNYIWSNGATTANISGLGAGAYTVTITDANGCNVVKTENLVQPDVLTISTQVITNVSCNGAGDGNIDITVIGGTLPPYIFIWSNGSTNEDLTNLSGGTYSVTVTDVNNCSYTTSYTINEPIILTASISSSSSPTCNGANNGAVDLTVAGGTAAYIYNWSNGATTQDLSGLAGGTFSVTVTDANGCTATTSSTIILVEPLVLTISPTVQNVSCNGNGDGSISLSVSGGTPVYNYNWSNGNTTSALINLSPGTFSVTVTDANGCSATSTSIITQPLTLSATVTSYTDTLGCNATGTGAIDISVFGGTTAYSYNWSNGSTTQDLSGLSAGTYNVTITDANGCTTTLSADLTIVQVDHPIASTTITNVTGCFGNSNGAIDLTITDGQAPFTYSWSNGSTTQDLSTLVAGVYSVTVLDVNGCSTTASATVTEPALLIATVSASSTNVTCNGAADGTVVLNVSGGTPLYNYNWSNGNTTSALINLSPGTFSVTVTDANGCTATTSSIITEPVVLSASVITFSDTLGCNATGTGAIDISVSGGTTAYSYNWSNGSTTQDLSGLSAGTYNVTITDANGCTTTLSADLTIVQVDHPIASTTITNVTGCFGNSNGAIDLTITDGLAPFTYTWSNGETSQNISGLTAGIYSVTVLDVNGCSTTTSATVTEPQLLIATVAASSTNVTCFGACDGSVVLTVSGGTSPYNYQWSNGSTTASLNNLCPGTYDVTVTDANGCTATTSDLITEPLALTISVDAWTDTLGCTAAGTGSIDISVTGGTPGYSYNWNNGATTQDLSLLSEGSYNVTVTDANGCTTVIATSLDIVQVGSPTAVADPTNVSGCFGDTTGSVDLTVTDGQAPFTYTWSNGATTEDLTGVIAGAYAVTVIDVNGCSTIASTIVDQPTAVNASAINPTNVTCNGAADGSIDLTPSGGTAPYTFNWSNGETTEDLTGLDPAIYNVTVSDANGCTATGTANITEPDVLMIMDTVITNVTCFGSLNGGIDITIMGGTAAYSYSWSNGATTEDLTNISGNIYYVTVTDVNNCQAIDSFSVNEPMQLIANITITDSISCSGINSDTINLTVSGGTAAYNFNWSNGATTEDLANVAAGNYTVTITDANGCTATATVNLTEPQPLNATATQSLEVNCNGNATGVAVVTASGGTAPYTYLWSTTSVNDTITGLLAATYFVTVTDAHGCSDTTNVVITQPLVLDATIVSITDVNCQNLLSGAIDISVAGGTSPYNYNWSNSETAQDLNAIAAGTYFVTVTDANGCTDTLSAIVDPAIAITASINTDVNISCHDATNGALSVNTTGGIAPFSYIWSNGSTTLTVSGLSSGTYTVTVTDATGCSDVATATLDNPAPPTFTGGGTTIACGTDGTLTATLPTGYTGTWTLINGTGNIADPSLSVTVVTGLGNTNNVFVWTISNGTCTFTDTATLIVTDLNADAGNDQSTCDTVNIQLSGSMSSGSGTWSSSDNGITFSNEADPSSTTSGLAVGQNIIVWTVTDGNCIATDTLIITVKPPEECNEDTLQMPTGFSPNGDGPNDYFVIHGLIHYPDNNLMVFNRWGNKVYEKKNYNNEWDGTNNSGDKLPDGTYFVIFESSNLTTPLSGYVDMRR
ncbi:hypothetical protein LBMAG27_20410 [Bacteroidota bacterium]|nr:hypothetical protein LBMAG27_20410 [Bacteroidota bacterium]